MKKIISILILLLSFVYVSNAQTYYKATFYAKARVTNGDYTWGDWKECDMKVCVDFHLARWCIQWPNCTGIRANNRRL